MTVKVCFFKDRQKFAAAHFTIFADGEAERLHGHNYEVSVSFTGKELEMGLLAPFHLLKKEVNAVCAAWDEYVLLPTANPWGRYEEQGDQVLFHLETPLLKKHYSFPKEDVILLDCDNVSCENMALLFSDLLISRLDDFKERITEVEVTIGESRGQTVTITRTL